MNKKTLRSATWHTTKGKHFDHLESFLKVEGRASVMTKTHQKVSRFFVSALAEPSFACSKWFKVATQCVFLWKMNASAVLFSFWLFSETQNPVLASNGRSLQPQQKKSKLHFKQVCGQCGFEIRAHRPCDTTRGKHFDNLESFLRVLDTFERLHDLLGWK